MPEIPSIAARVSAAYIELTNAADILNVVSDALGKAVSDIDDGLKKLNLGIIVWVNVYEDASNSDDPNYYIEEIGYSKISSKWGITLRTRAGNEYSPDDREDVETWLFNDAPRTLRLKAIEKLPELVNKLSQEAAMMTKQLQSRLEDAQAVAAAINPPSRGFVVKGLAANHKSVSKMPQPHGISSAAMIEAARQSSVVSKEMEQQFAKAALESSVAFKETEQQLAKAATDYAGATGVSLKSAILGVKK